MLRSLLNVPRFAKTFLQKEITQPQEAAKLFEPQRKQIYKSVTGKVPDSIYNQWLDLAKDKSLAIPAPEADLPYNFLGIDNIPDVKYSFLFDEMLNQNEILPKQLLGHLIKIYKGLLHSLSTGDAEFITEYCEETFAEKTLQSLDRLRQAGDKLVAFEDLTPTNGEPFPSLAFFIDQLLIRGLSVKRGENLPESAYHYFHDNDELGVMIFTPHQLSEPQHFMKKEDGDRLYEDYKKVIARCLVRIQSPLRLKLMKGNGMELLAPSDEYSYNHLVMFESQCEQPPKMRVRKSNFTRNVKKFQHESYMEWMRNFTPKVWRICDVDNWMKSNPILRRKENIYTDEMFKGTKYDQNIVDVRRIVY